EGLETVLLETKNIFENHDWDSAVSYYMMGILGGLFTQLFVIGDITGWAAHIIERRQDKKFIGHSANYTWPEDRPFVSIDDRC
ncbi:2-methylcitrate synthase, partial [Leptospira interrogans serovar Pomona]|nr:2-methylcitrate synthase [Leptospira interrogans serovar Pomona]